MGAAGQASRRMKCLLGEEMTLQPFATADTDWGCADGTMYNSPESRFVLEKAERHAINPRTKKTKTKHSTILDSSTQKSL